MCVCVCVCVCVYNGQQRNKDENICTLSENRNLSLCLGSDANIYRRIDACLGIGYPMEFVLSEESMMKFRSTIYEYLRGRLVSYASLHLSPEFQITECKTEDRWTVSS
jgi:hypothetical protein